MGPGYYIESLNPPVEKNDVNFPLVIKRNFDTEMESAGAPVFYFFEDVEARECLETLLAQ